MDREILKGKKIVVGVAGSIACYKTLELIKELKKYGADVFVILTESSRRLIGINDFKRVAGKNIYTSLFHPNINYADYIKNNKEIKHISLADIADVFIICPATANIIGKIAGGIADDLLTTSVMETNAPVLICPAMNVKMWKNPIVQENISRLRKLNYNFTEPEYGELACGYTGVGRLADMGKILEDASLLLEQKNDLKNKKILVTEGATFEEIDPVRIITNKSSGKMGARIAEQAFLRGAEVILLRGHNSAEPQYNIKEEKFTTVQDLFSKIKKYIKDVDVVIHSAAVSDFELNNKSVGGDNGKKIKSNKNLHLELTPTAKILEKLKKLNDDIFLVGFKAEYKVSEKKLIDSACRLLKSSGADLIVANDVGKENVGFDYDTNEVFVVDKTKKVYHIPLIGKKSVADKIMDILAGCLKS